MLKPSKVPNENMAYLAGQIRTRVAKRHISLTLVYKALAICFSYLLIPLTINYLDVEQYGIWMTLLAVMSWIVFFDMGLGNGMKNKLAEALAENNIGLAKTYVSTGYAAVGFIAIILFVILIFVLPFVPWNKVFNTTSVSNVELSQTVLVVGSFLLINFVMSLCNSVFYAYQKASLVAMSGLLLNCFALISIYALIHYSVGGLLYLSVFYGLSMVLSNILLTYYFFRKYNKITPSLKYVNFRKIRKISSLGIKFFIVQIAVLVIFATDNMIITQVLGPEHVTSYNIVFKLFSIITVGHSIVVAPLWSAYTEAYAKKDLPWIRSTLKKLNLLMIPIIIAVSILVVFARDITNIWVGPEIIVSQLSVVLMGVYVVVSVWSNIYAYFVNGIGEIRLQMYSAIFAGLINLPLSIYFAKYLNMGINGVILGTIASLSIFAIIGPVQTYFILKPIHRKLEFGP